MNRFRASSGVRFAQALLVAGISSCGGGGSSSVAPPVVTLTTLEITPSSDSLAAGQSRQFALTGHYSDGSTQDLTVDAAWTSSVPVVASLENGLPNAGHALALSAGDTLVRGTFALQHAEAALHVTPAVAVQVLVTPSALQLPLAVEQPLVATATFTDASVHDVTSQCAWASSDPAVVAVGTAAGDTGVLHSLTTGAANVTATLDGQIGAVAVEVLPIDVLELAVPVSAALATPHVAFAAAGGIEAVWCHQFAIPGELYVADFDPATGWTSPQLYDSSSLADRVFRPQIAVGGLGNTLIAWDGHAGLYAASRAPGGGFSLPTVIASGPSPFLSFVGALALRMDAAGRGLLVWKDANNQTIQSARFLPHTGWSAPITVVADAPFIGVGALRLEMNTDGTGFLMWIVGSVTSSWRIYAARFDPVSGWEAGHLLADLALPDPFDVAINASGAAIATWTDSFPAPSLFAARYVPGQGWLAPEQISDSNAAHDPSVALAASGDAFVEWRNSGNFDVEANRYVVGVGWQGVEVLVDLFFGDPTVLKPFMNEAGDIVAFWEKSSVPPRVQYRHYDPTFGWQPVQSLDFLGFDGAASELVLETDPSGRSVLTWQESIGDSDFNSAYAHRFHVP